MMMPWIRSNVKIVETMTRGLLASRQYQSSSVANESTSCKKNARQGCIILHVTFVRKVTLGPKSFDIVA